MTRPILAVEGLSKRHYHGAQTGYIALRALVETGRSEAQIAKPSFFSRFGEPFWALRDISFEVGPGERLAVIGGNGAGKSTLLKILARVVRPTTGRAWHRGRMAAMLEVGTGFNTDLTGRENATVNAAVMGMDSRFIKRKLDEIVAFAELEEAIDTPLKFYSTGMKARLAFSIAAFMEPDILIADEVLAVGDAKFQRACLQKMSSLGEQGSTVIFVSHSMPQVLRLCTRGIWLDQGKVVMDGAVADVAAAYGAKQMNMTGEDYENYRPKDAKDPVRLVSLRALKADGEPTTQFDVRDPVTLELRYEVLADGLQVAPEISLIDANHQEILVTGVRQAQQAAATSAPGAYVGHVTVPGDLLNEGVHHLTVRVLSFERHERLAESREALTLFVGDQATGDSARGDYLGPISGMVRPKLDWTIRLDPQAVRG